MEREWLGPFFLSKHGGLFRLQGARYDPQVFARADYYHGGQSDVDFFRPRSAACYRPPSCCARILSECRLTARCRRDSLLPITEPNFPVLPRSSLTFNTGMRCKFSVLAWSYLETQRQVSVEVSPGSELIKHKTESRYSSAWPSPVRRANAS